MLLCGHVSLWHLNYKFGMFEKEEQLRALLCGKETQFCQNSMASRPDIMWCVANCSIMCKILAIYGVGKSDGIKIKKKE